jgi:hypothetical protein
MLIYIGLVLLAVFLLRDRFKEHISEAGAKAIEFIVELAIVIVIYLLFFDNK